MNTPITITDAARKTAQKVFSQIEYAVPCYHGYQKSRRNLTEDERAEVIQLAINTATEQLQSRVKELEGDKERLDWLAISAKPISGTCIYEICKFFRCEKDWVKESVLRNELDSAITAEQKGEGK